MNSDGFTISFSNFSSLDIYPHNSLSSFKFNLPTPMDFGNEKWEVALVSFSYPNSWFIVRDYSEIKSESLSTRFSIPRAEVKIDADFQSRLIPNLASNIYYYGRGGVRHTVTHKDKVIYTASSPFYLPFNYFYEERFDFIKIVNQKVNSSKGFNEADVLMIGGTAHVNSGGQIERLKCLDKQFYDLVDKPSKNLVESDILKNGADSWLIEFNIKGVIAEDYILPIPATVSQPRQSYLPAIFLYAPQLVQSRNVGDKDLPLLGFVPYTGEETPTDVVTYVPKHRRFQRVAQGYISEIAIELKDSYGDFLVFKSGEVTLDLQFRKCH